MSRFEFAAYIFLGIAAAYLFRIVEKGVVCLPKCIGGIL
jgi:hypothetical protein